MERRIIKIKIVKAIWKLILPLISFLFISIYLFSLFGYIDVKLNLFESSVFIGGFIGFLIMSFLSYRLKIEIDYGKRTILVRSYKKIIISFEAFESYDFEEQRTVDFNIFYHLYILCSNSKKIKLSLSFSAFSKKGFSDKKEEMSKHFNNLVNFKKNCML